MRIRTFEALDYLNSLWNQYTAQSIDDHIDQFATNVCISLCVISILPFTVCYDIGYKIGNDCYERKPEEWKEEEKPLPPPLRRSARLAEKRAKKL